MRVFVAGATGVLGRRLVADLVDRGHDVIGLVRDDTGEEQVIDRGGEPRWGDVLEPETIDPLVEDVDAIVHAATAIPTSEDPTDEEWAVNDSVRRDGTRNLLDAAVDAGVDRFLLESIVWVARQPDGSTFDEDATPHPNERTRSALDAERMALGAMDDHDLATGILRCGFFYAPDSAHTRQFGRDLLAGDLPIIGGGLLGRRDVPLSWIHVDDAATAFATAVETGVTGRFHVVDNEPASPAAFLQGLADRLDAPDPGRVPGWLAKHLADPDAVRLLTNPMPTSNDRFTARTGWSPTYPTYREGLDAVVETWIEDGTVVPTADGLQWHTEKTGGTDDEDDVVAADADRPSAN